MLFVPQNTRSNEMMKTIINCDSFDQEKYILQHLKTQLKLFKRSWLSENGWRQVIHDKDELNLYSKSSIFDVRNKCKYLSKAIEHAIESYNQSGWLHCCQCAINDVIAFENVNFEDFDKYDKYNQRWYISSPKTIMSWYQLFNHSNNEHFINEYSINKKKISTFS